VTFLAAWDDVYLFRFLLYRTELSAYPFQISPPQGAISDLEEEAKAAGLSEGDLLRDVDGHRIDGTWDVTAAIHDHRAGEAVPMGLERDGIRRVVPVRLVPQRRERAPLLAWLFDIEQLVVTPWFALTLGAFVALLRPRDPLAWLVLGLMTSFSQLTGVVREAALTLPRSASAAAVGFQATLGSCWAIFMLLFGQYFPDRVSTSRFARGARWALLPPLILLALTNGTLAAVRVVSFNALSSAEAWVDHNSALAFVLVSVALAVFFSTISTKAAMAGPDDRRRLKLLFWGTAISTSPTALLVLHTIVTGRSPETLPAWIFMPVLLLLLGFPLTLAYGIVVQRAMDVRVVVREGLKYALAQRGVRVMQAVISLGVLITLVNLASDPTTRRPQRYQAAAFGVLAVVALQRLSGRAQRWIDQRFFREAVNSERILGELNDKVRTIVGRDPLLAMVASAVSQALHVPKIAVLLPREAFLQPAFAIGYEGGAPPVSIPSNGELALRLSASRGPLEVFRDDADVRVQRDTALAGARPQLEQLESALLLPLTFRDRLLGLLSLGPRMGDAPYTRNDKHLLTSVAIQTALALENSDLAAQIAHEVAQRERYLRDLEIAREVQERLYPQAPPVPKGLACAGHCRPARAVGGDYYDLFGVPGGQFGIAIGDISGKGIPAALLMASLQAYLRGLTLAEVPRPALLMENINRLVLESTPDNRYATFFYGQYDPSTREFTYVNGGHVPPLVFRAGGTVERLDVGGPVVGLITPVTYTQKTLTLEKGDLVVMYTDGISEAMNAGDEEFGEERLVETVRAHPGASPSDLIGSLIAAADEFAAGAPQHDDVTVLVVRVG
jgi:sigma-B regulation protein RsbU (phosphoserine phosphatase)